MNSLDILLLIGIVAGVILAVRHMKKNKGDCCGDCAKCGRCSQAFDCEKKKEE